MGHQTLCKIMMGKKASKTTSHTQKDSQRMNFLEKMNQIVKKAQKLERGYSYTTQMKFLHNGLQRVKKYDFDIHLFGAKSEGGVLT
jgi:hypothetical protein